MPFRRLQAPVENGAVLSDPSFEQIPERVAANRRLFHDSNISWGTISLRELRALARQEVLTEAIRYTHPERKPDPSNLSGPLLLAGHQPELSHPGVWVKNFALQGLARCVQGCALNLIVDNDTLKSTTVRLPVLHREDPTLVRLEAIPFDRFDREEPYESRVLHDADCFQTFPDRVRVQSANWGFQPLVTTVWHDVLNQPSMKIGERFAATRRLWEQRWGCENLELPVSRLCQTKAFRIFVEQIMASPVAFREAYNSALREYRQLHQLRSANHPASDLSEADGLTEIPFWEFTSTGQRNKVLVNHSEPVRVPPSLRPRALTLTLFLRLCLGDFFIHGLGGGKYDEVTNTILRNLFGIEPPHFQVLTATLRLPLPTFASSAETVEELTRRERDLYWNPQRYLQPDVGTQPKVKAILQEHERLLGLSADVQANRKQLFRDFRTLGDQLRGYVEGGRAETAASRKRAQAECAANAILQRRDYAWVLFPEELLRPFLQRFLN